MKINDRRNRYRKFVYNAIQIETLFYFYIYVIDVARMDVLVYNSQFDIWSLGKATSCIEIHH